MDKNTLLENIRNGKESRELAIRSLYDNPQLRAGLKKVLFLSQENDEFYDIFNLTLVQFMKTVIKNPDFDISSNVHSYLFVIAKNIAISKRRKKKLDITDLDSSHIQISDENPTIDLQILFTEKMILIKSMVENMGRNCYKILWNWASGFNMREIAEKLEYSSAEVVRRKKFVCLKRLSTYLEENPSIRERFK